MAAPHAPMLFVLNLSREAAFSSNSLDWIQIELNKIGRSSRYGLGLISNNKIRYFFIQFKCNQFKIIFYIKWERNLWPNWAVIVAQLAEQPLPIAEIRGSNPVTGKILY